MSVRLQLQTFDMHFTVPVGANRLKAGPKTLGQQRGSGLPPRRRIGRDRRNIDNCLACD